MIHRNRRCNRRRKQEVILYTQSISVSKYGRTNTKLTEQFIKVYDVKACSKKQIADDPILLIQMKKVLKIRVKNRSVACSMASHVNAPTFDEHTH